MFDRPTPPHKPVTIERKQKRKRKKMRRKRDLLGWSKKGPQDAHILVTALICISASLPPSPLELHST
jgi:hypothetical protein